MKLLVKTLGCIAGLLLSGAVSALGMGSINVMSSLGEPLNAEIDLLSVTKAERASLSARLASPEVFKGAGIDYPSSLPKLKFEIAARPSGAPYIRLSSAQPINDPFVSILVELNASSGRLLREFTFLLDPPGFRSEQAKGPSAVPNDVKPIEPSAAAKPAPAPAPKSEPAPPPPAAPVRAQPLPAADEAAPTPVKKKTAQSGNVSAGEITVKRGDTLSRLAEQNRPPNVSLERMLAALYRANADVFDGGNMNRLRTGKILRLPDANEINDISQADAVQEIRAQTADWNAYRQKLASTATPSAQTESGREASGRISATIADKAPPVREDATDVVRLSRGEAPGDKTALSPQDKLHAMEEEAIAKKKLVQESNERIAILEKNIQEMQRLLALKALPAGKQPAAAAPEARLQAAVVPSAVPPNAAPASAVPASSVASASAVPPARKPKPAAPRVVAPPPSLLDEILNEPLYLAGLAAVVLAAGGAGLVAARRRKTAAPAPAENPAVPPAPGNVEHIAAPVPPSPDTGDFTQAAAAQPAQPPQAEEEVDPISEAELFLSFGRDAQAEEILKDALAKDPANNRIRLNLLSIYENRKDAAAFAPIAREVMESGDGAAWAQAAEMGRRLDPTNPLYGGEASEEPAPSATAAAAPSLDFDLGLEKADAHPAPQEAPHAAPDLDLDLTAAAPAAPAAPQPAEPSALDFDLGAATPEPAVAAEPAPTLPQPEELVFEVPVARAENGAAASAESAPAVETAEPETAAEAPGFTLDFPLEDSASSVTLTAGNKAPDAALTDINLHLDEPAAQAPAPAAQDEARDAHWHDVATKLDLAKAYQEMGDSAGAREILEEVVSEGDAEQKAAAQAMLAQLP